MPEDIQIHEYYSVSCRAYDESGGADSRLGAARRKFFQNRRPARGSVSAVENGRKIHIRYKIGEKCFQWKKTGGGVTLQEAFSVSGGCWRFVEHSMEGCLLSAASYDAGLHWLQTAYYSGDPKQPLAVLKREEGGILCRRYIPGETCTEILLLPEAWEPGTALQSCVNAQAGEPVVTAETDAGRLCFCTEEERKLRQQLREKLCADPSLLTPNWAEQEETELNFAVIVNDGSAKPGPEKAENPPENRPEKKQSPKREKSRKKKAEYAADRESTRPEDRRRPAKYAVAAKGLSGAVQGAFGRKEPQPPEKDMIPAKRIVVSSMEKLLLLWQGAGGPAAGLWAHRTQQRRHSLRGYLPRRSPRRLRRILL